MPRSDKPTISAGRRRIPTRIIVFLLVGASLTLLDQWTKLHIVKTIPETESVSIIGDFVRITHIRNPGAMWGFASSGGWYRLPLVLFLFGNAFLLLSGLERLMRPSAHRKDEARDRAKKKAKTRASGNAPESHTADNKSQTAASETYSLLGSPARDVFVLSLLLAGALGNTIDRMAQGYVIDFLDVGLPFWRWPVFNVADICITVGVVTAAISYLQQAFAESPAPSKERAKTTGWLGHEVVLLIICGFVALVGYGCTHSTQFLNLLRKALIWFSGLAAVAILACYLYTEWRRYRMLGRDGAGSQR